MLRNTHERSLLETHDRPRQQTQGLHSGCGDNSNSINQPSQGWKFTKPRKTQCAWDFSQETQLQVRVIDTQPQPCLESCAPVTSPWLLFSTPVPDPALPTQQTTPHLNSSHRVNEAPSHRKACANLNLKARDGIFSFLSSPHADVEGQGVCSW